MKLSDYQARALETALPTALTPEYLNPALLSEVYELGAQVFGDTAKMIRDQKLDNTKSYNATVKEYGDVAWVTAIALHVQGVKEVSGWDEPVGEDFHDFTNRLIMKAQIAVESDDTFQLAQIWQMLKAHSGILLADMDFDEVLEANLAKLADRKQRGVIGGSGDER